MWNTIAIGIGGFIGAIGRYGVGQLYKSFFPAAGFPFATLSVNVIGAFVIGFAAQYFEKVGLMGSSLQMFIMVGLLGGFTTFSSFSLETVNLIGSGRMIGAVGNVFFNVFLCLLGVWLGKVAATGGFGA